MRTAALTTATLAVAGAVGLLTTSVSSPEASAIGPRPDAEHARSSASSRVSYVERQVARRNQLARARTAAHAVDGWVLVESEPPDPGVLALDPALLPDREDELRLQLATVPVQADGVDAAATIAARATDRRTREAAILALGRSRAAGAQEALVDLYARIADPAERALVIDQLRPADLDGTVADWMIGALGASDVTEAHKHLLVSQLVVSALPADGGTGAIVGELRSRAPAEWRPEIDHRYRALAARSLPPAPK